MAASAGRNLRIKFDPGAGAVAVTGSTQDGFEITKEGIPITDKDDAGVQTFLDEPGTWAMSGNVEGYTKDDTILLLANDSTTFLYDVEIDVAGLGTYSGSFGITNFSATGVEGAEAITFTMTIASSGAITYT